MVDDDIANRRAGAAAMGWDARDFWLAEKVDNDPVFPDIRFSWWSGALRADAAPAVAAPVQHPPADAVIAAARGSGRQ